MRKIADWFDRGVQTAGNVEQIARIKSEVEEFAKSFPLPHLKVETE